MRAVALFVAAFAVLAAAISAVPSFPDQYYLEAVFSLPYANISEPIRVHYDATNTREKIDFYDGLDGYLYRYDKNVSYELFVRMDHRECAASKGSADLVSLFPDLTGWKDMGQVTFRGLPCDHFQHEERDGGKVNTYDFYSVVSVGTPVQFHMMGYDTVFGSHYDEYVLDYGLFIPGLAPAAAFDVPALCDAPAPAAEHTIRRGALQLGALFPRAAGGGQYAGFASRYGRQCGSADECAHRQRAFEANAARVEAHNAASPSYRMALNQFADMTFEEFVAVHLPSAGRLAPSVASRTHAAGDGMADPPASLDWRERGAVTPVKDQGACGSCWSFSAIGAIEGQQFLATGRLVSLSEQHLVDCAWNYGTAPYSNNGCDGGLPFWGMQYIIDSGGVATEEAYPYRMQDDYCHFDGSHVGARLSAYVNVTSGDEAALLDAVATHGPVSVAIDVTESLVFYASGVYYEPTCGSRFEQLNHGVLVVGYGSEGGADYWLVKNSWSTHWGDGGYVKMARNRDNNCGIATAAVYSVIAPSWRLRQRHRS